MCRTEAAPKEDRVILGPEVSPEIYRVHLTPDLERFVFTGAESIHVKVRNGRIFHDLVFMSLVNYSELSLLSLGTILCMCLFWRLDSDPAWISANKPQEDISIFYR